MLDTQSVGFVIDGYLATPYKCSLLL